jgi:hypothetical protein
MVLGCWEYQGVLHQRVGIDYHSAEPGVLLALDYTSVGYVNAELWSVPQRWYASAVVVY